MKNFMLIFFGETGEYDKQGAAIDGPYLDVKESVGGYYIVKAATMKDAIAIARDYPDFDLVGGVEVRECMSDDEG